MRKLLFLLCLPVLLSAQPYDLVLRNGRVVDPASGLDAIRHVGIRGRTIAAVSPQPLQGKVEIDATGLVIAPGFIDLHSHGQTPENYRYKAMDGVTTALELEVGVYPVGEWYAARAGKALINYGASSGHIPARMKVMGDSGDFLPRAAAMNRLASSTERERIVQEVRRGLDEGGLGLGLGLAYTPTATGAESLELFTLAAEWKRPVFVHVRHGNAGSPGIVESLQEVIGNAAATGASLHVVHINSSSTRSIDTALRMIAGARSRGLDVTTEAYPYIAGATRLDSALFEPGWQQRMGIDYKDLLWTDTGERLTAESFARYRKQGGRVILFTNTEEMVHRAVTAPGVMIASDGGLSEGTGHPRSAGAYSRILGRYVREEKVLTLMDALRKMTSLPAERLAKMSPAMQHKGRLQVGADADLVAFDPATVIDHATYEKPAQYSEGFRYVLVEGVPVVRDGRLVEGVTPGRPILARQ
jgi:N-acyl-D-aspartate/D-glutamate deacylase